MSVANPRSPRAATQLHWPLVNRLAGALTDLKHEAPVRATVCLTRLLINASRRCCWRLSPTWRAASSSPSFLPCCCCCCCCCWRRRSPWSAITGRCWTAAAAAAVHTAATTAALPRGPAVAHAERRQPRRRVRAVCGGVVAEHGRSVKRAVALWEVQPALGPMGAALAAGAAGKEPAVGRACGSSCPRHCVPLAPWEPGVGPACSAFLAPFAAHADADNVR